MPPMLLDSQELLQLFTALENMAIFLEKTSAKGGQSNTYQYAISPTASHLLPSGSLLPPADGSHPSFSCGAITSEEHPVTVTGLCLPRTCSGEPEQLLRELGRTMRHTITQLRAETDQQLVFFYKHMRQKEMSELELISQSRQIVPDGFHFMTAATTDLDGFSRRSSTKPSRGVLQHGRRPSQLRLSGSLPRGLDAALPPLAATIHASAIALHDNQPQPSNSAAHGATSNKVGSLVGASPNHNAPLSRKLTERRLASTALQSFLYLLLECALTQANASCGAVYMSSMKLSKDGEVKVVDSPPDYLHRVAHVNATGKLPQDVNYASANTLVTVVESGVALNICNSDVDGLTEDAAAIVASSRNADKAIHKALNISTGIIVPVRNFGCIVLANKRSPNGTVGASFTTIDEHVAWGTANSVAALLTRYQRELLQQFTCAPVAELHLRKFMILPPIDIPRRESAMTGRGTGVLVFMSKHANHGEVSKVLTIVRTEDSDTARVVPGESIPRRNRVTRSKQDRLNDEDLFQGAANYIRNLESLWLQSIQENNTMQTILDHYSRELESREERVTCLEASVRRLNARVAHLERSQLRNQ